MAEAAHISSAAALGVGPIEPGDVVSVSRGDRPYAAYVTKVLNASDADGNTTVRVQYYEYDAEVEVSLISVKTDCNGDFIHFRAKLPLFLLFIYLRIF